MKTIYGYTDEMEKKFEELEKKYEMAETTREALIIMGVDPNEATFGEIMLKGFTEMFGIPEEIWAKKVVDITENEVKLLDDLFSSTTIEFNRAN